MAKYKIFSDKFLESIYETGNKPQYGCDICSHYQPVENGDSDFGPNCGDEYECTKELDLSDNGKPIKNFNRECGRDCCSCDFFKVLGRDKEIANIFSKIDMKSSDDMDNWASYKRFKEKYTKK